jgi:(hydroxyamino)benzene mutase
MLIIAGVWLVLLGLVQGAAVPLFANPRMALSAHLTAVQSGMAIMILGVVWPMARWSTRVETMSCRAIAFGSYGLWVGLMLAAATGASRALPIAGQGFGAALSVERVVAGVVTVASGLILTGWALFAIAVTRRPRD